MNFIKVTSLSLAAALAVVVCSRVLALELGGAAVGGHFSIPISDFAQRKFLSVYKQEYDFSCGSAALASLLTYHYEDPVYEHEVFVDMYNHGNKEKIKDKGFSLLDMKKYLQRRGYSSDGFIVKLEQLNVPAITIVNMGGYMHFIVIKGVNEREVLIGDPSVGVKSIDRHEFQEMWNNGILFMIYDNAEIASNYFQSKEDWALRVKAPVEAVISRDSIARDAMLKHGDHDI